MSLRRQQLQALWKESSKESLFQEAFGLPDSESVLAEVFAVLSLKGKEEAFSGKLYLSDDYLTFASLDRKACRLSLPLATVRRVEKLAPGQEGTAPGAFALKLTLFHGFQIVLQLNSLRQTCDNFCALLRTRLKSSLPLMKSLKPFAKTFFSEYFLAEGDGGDPETETKDDAPLIDLEEKPIQPETNLEWTTGEGTDRGYHGGLGLIFKFPGDARKLREKSKMKLWKEYMTLHGRNLTLIKYPAYTRLVQVGLPNRLRGEMWEVSCGSIFLRLSRPGVYAQIVKENQGRAATAATEDIEKDLHRSLPEYAAYQDPRGIDAMRRVLTAYAYSNPAVGYCQAMNLIVASFLIYMSEEQCFWCLSILCDRLLPGYYSPSMYGTVLDQRVFEHLVERCLPTLHDHFVATDIQLSIASLPWFLSCYISAMPMIFAFRIIDNLFLNGPKVLFQVGLAILRINGAELLDSLDDGMFINTIKAYFLTLGDSAHPNSTDPRLRSITRFQELLVVAFREFSGITHETIESERRKHRKAVVVSIENFAKRSTLRNLKFGSLRLDKEQLGRIYDHFQLASLKAREEVHLARAGMKTRDGSHSVAATTRAAAAAIIEAKEREEEANPDPRLDRTGFSQLIAGVAAWARDELIVKNGFHEHIERTPVSHHFIDRLYAEWDWSKGGQGLNLQDVVRGLDSVLFNDLMSSIEWMFNLHDGDKDGYLTKDEVLALSESLLFIFRNEPGDRYLGAVSNMLHNAFEYAESVKTPLEPKVLLPGDDVDGRYTPPLVNVQPDRPYLNLATFRMVVLAEELLESFFDIDLRSSWKLEVLIAEEKPKPAGVAASWFGGLMEVLVTDENKERLNRLGDLAGRSLKIQRVEQKPSLGKLDSTSAFLDPTSRGSLLSRPAAISTSTSSPTLSLPPISIPINHSEPFLAPHVNPWANDTPLSSTIPIEELDIESAAARTILERPQFVMDATTQGQDEEEDFDFGDEDDDGAEIDPAVLAEVDRFLIDDEESTNKVNEWLT